MIIDTKHPLARFVRVIDVNSTYMVRILSVDTETKTAYQVGENGCVIFETDMDGRKFKTLAVPYDHLDFSRVPNEQKFLIPMESDMTVSQHCD